MLRYILHTKLFTNKDLIFIIEIKLSNRLMMMRHIRTGIYLLEGSIHDVDKY